MSNPTLVDTMRPRRDFLSYQLSRARHDLRNPLSEILGFSEILIEEVPSAGSSALLDHLQAIHRTATLVLKHVNQELNPEALRLDPNRLSDLQQTITGSAKDLCHRAETLLPLCASLEGGTFVDDVARIAESARQLGSIAAPLLGACHPPLAPSLPATDDQAFPTTGYRALDADDSLPVATRPPLAAETILIVDDNPGNCALLKRRLERQGHAAVIVENGRQALELLDTRPFGAVLLDIMMPEVNGFQVLEAMRANGSLARTPVIVLSASDESDGVARCIEMGAEDYLPKPFDPVLLRARLGACLEKKLLRDRERAAYAALERSQQRLAGELAKAASYVVSLLPAPLHGRVESEWCFQPSEQLGGDVFGWHWIDDDHLGIYLLDVCGHGVGAALLSVTVLNTLRTQTLPKTNFREPRAVLTSLNRLFAMEKQNYLYFTIWYGVYCPSRREVRYSSGGHPPALLLDARHSPPAVCHNPDSGLRGVALADPIPLATAGPAIGCFEEAQFICHAQSVKPGARLLVFSDGVFEIFLDEGKVQTWDNFLAGFQNEDVSRMRPAEHLKRAQKLRGCESLEDDFSLMEFCFP